MHANPRAIVPVPESGLPGFQCPIHGEPLLVEDEKLVCAQNHSFGIVRKIPRYVESYAGHFGLQWNTFPLTQLDSRTGTTISLDRLKQCLGEEIWAGLEGKQVLECGCGSGRFTEVLLDRGACVNALDLSEAVDSCRSNCNHYGNVRFGQADIMALPFAPQQFDLVLCIGVIQHTPDPDLAIAKLWDQVKPGGWLVIDHYSFSKLRYYLTAAPYFRRVLNSMSKERALQWTNRMVRYAFPLQLMLRNHPIPSKLVARFIPVNTYFRVYPQLSDQLQFEWAMLDTHDSMTDGYKHSRSVPEIQRTLDGLGAVEVEVGKGGNGVEARARRPNVEAMTTGLLKAESAA